MRQELSASVVALFAASRSQPQVLTVPGSEFDRLNRAVNLVVRLRGSVERDRYKRDILSFHGREGTGRIGLALERLLAGLDTLGVERAIALDVVEAVAMDSVPPLRRDAYEYLCTPAPKAGPQDPLPWRTTTDIHLHLGLPTTTIRRALEELCGYGLARENIRGPGRASLWQGVALP